MVFILGALFNRGRGADFYRYGKGSLRFKAKVRNIIEGGEGYQLREGGVRYKAPFKAEKDDIGLENIFLGDVNQ